MDIPKSFQPLPRHKGGLRVKTFLFSITDVARCDETVNAFCACHKIINVTLLKHGTRFGYAVVYLEPQAEKEATP